MGKLKDEQLFPREWLNRYTVEELERLAIKTESGIPDDEAEKQMIKEEKIERFLKKQNA